MTNLFYISTHYRTIIAVPVSDGTPWCAVIAGRPWWFVAIEGQPLQAVIWCRAIVQTPSPCWLCFYWESVERAMESFNGQRRAYKHIISYSLESRMQPAGSVCRPVRGFPLVASLLGCHNFSIVMAQCDGTRPEPVRCWMHLADFTQSWQFRSRLQNAVCLHNLQL